MNSMDNLPPVTITIASNDIDFIFRWVTNHNMLNQDESSFEKSVDLDQLTDKPADQDPNFFLYCL